MDTTNQNTEKGVVEAVTKSRLSDHVEQVERIATPYNFIPHRRAGFIRLTGGSLERQPITIPVENIAFCAGSGRGQQGNTIIQIKVPAVAVPVAEKPEQVAEAYMKAVNEGGMHSAVNIE